MTLLDKAKRFWRYGAKGSVYDLEHTQSIYDYIESNVKSQMLPDTFSLKDYDDPEAKIRFADGAQDGIALYRMGFSPLPKNIGFRIGRAISAACAGQKEEADRAFIELDEEYRILGIIDEIQAYVIDHLTSIQEDALFSYAVDCLCASVDIPLPKVGLSILELYGEPNDELKRLMRVLGLSDEYTLYVMWNMRHWEDASSELFELAKRVQGWGRVHIVKEIQPATEEMQRWLLFHGVEGYIPAAECALESYLKSGADDLMRSGMTYEEFEAVGRILWGIIDGPDRDLSQINDWQSVISRYLKDAERHHLGLGDYERLLYLLEHAPGCGFTGFEEQCDRLLRNERCTREVVSAVKKGEGLDLAAYLGIPYKETLLKLIEDDFDRHYSQCGHVSDKEHLPGLIEAFRANLPASAIEDRPLDELGWGEEWEVYSRLSFILQNLYHRMPWGLDLVLKGLTAPVNSCRNMSVRNLRLWVEDEKLPLESLSAEAYLALERAYCKEPREDFKEEMELLLDGVTEFEETPSREAEEQQSAERAIEQTRSSALDGPIERALRRCIEAAMSTWEAQDIYAVSLWVQDWDDDPFEPTVTLGYNTEEQVRVMTPCASSAEEARWNFAFWLQNSEMVFGGKEETVGGSSDLIIRWLQDSNVVFYTNEELDAMSPTEIDEALVAGENVTKHFVEMLVRVVQGLHDSGFIQERFGKEIPILIHELEYYEEIADQNARANGDALPEGFVAFCRSE